MNPMTRLAVLRCGVPACLIEPDLLGITRHSCAASSEWRATKRWAHDVFIIGPPPNSRSPGP